MNVDLKARNLPSTGFDDTGGIAPSYGGDELTWTNATGDFTDSAGYMLLDNASSTYTHAQTRTAHTKIKFKISSIAFGDGKLITLQHLRYDASYAAIIVYLSAVGQTNCNKINVSYNSVTTPASNGIDGNVTTTATGDFTLVAATEHTVEVMYRANSNVHTSDGIIKVWVDDAETPIINLTNLRFGTRSLLYQDIRVGPSAATVTFGAGTIKVTSFELASNRAFTAHTADTYYLDSVLGTHVGMGTEDDPVKSMSTVGDVVQAGDTICFVNNGPSYPYRTGLGNAQEYQVADGRLVIPRSGTAGKLIEITSDTGSACVTNTINATHNAAGYEWVAAATEGEYYLKMTGVSSSPFTSTASGMEPSFIAHCTPEVWTAQGIYGLTVIDAADKGTVGALAAGEYGWSTSPFNTIYYKPAADEDITTVHIEIPFGLITGSASDHAIRLTKDYYHFHHIDVHLGHTNGLELTGGGTGSYVHHVKGWFNSQHLLADSSAATVSQCESAYSTDAANGGGFLFVTGASGTKMGLYSHHHPDDCFEISCPSGTMDVKVIGCLAYASNTRTDVSSEGFGFELDVTPEGQTQTILNCVAISCSKGLRNLNNSATSVVTIKNFGAYNCSLYGIHESSTGLSATYSNNGFYNCTSGNGNVRGGR